LVGGGEDEETTTSTRMARCSHNNRGRANRTERPRRRSKPRKEEGALEIESVNQLIEANSKAHHTDFYDLCDPDDDYDDNGKKVEEQLVVRRGQDVEMELTLNREYNKETDLIRLVLNYDCKSPNDGNGTQIKRVFAEKVHETKPHIKEYKDSEKKVVISFKFPMKNPIGRWKIKLVAVAKEKGKKHRSPIHVGMVYVIFNPWLQGDLCFMEGDAEKEEYVLAETSSVFKGSKSKIYEKRWNVAHGDRHVLPLIIDLLDESDLRLADRGNPILISRVLASMMNSCDNNGVLVGAWPTKDGDFGYGWKEGTSPMDWNGSSEILLEYSKTRKCVNYGQCWVFSGILMTACRALGIPCRSVTNFASAHDNDASVTIDTVFDQDGKRLYGDSVWNFHVWDEVFLARPDLKEGFGGWQAIDATPQEPSQGIYTCGPAPLKAIKEGDIDVGQDTPFVFAEVNADRVYKQLDEDGEETVIRVLKNSVGKNISTKKLGSFGREDVTCNYKYAEESEQERQAVLKAVKRQDEDLYEEVYGVPDNPDVTFTLEDSEKINIGEDIEIDMMVRNNSDEKRTIDVTVVLSSIFYTGAVSTEVKTEQFDAVINAKGEHKITMTVPDEVYRPKLVEQCCMKVDAKASVRETKQIFSDEDTFELAKPGLEVIAPDSVKAKEEFTLEVVFTNPLKDPLTKGFFSCEMARTANKKEPLKKVISPNQKITKKITMMAPKKPCCRELLVSFTSTELYEITGSATINVK